MFKKIVIYITYIVVILFALLAISSKLSIGGFKLLVVKSGSMEPAIKTGSMIVDKSSEKYNVGDIITFKDKEKPSETTTHRIADIKYQDNKPLFTTKGDANDTPDAGQVDSSRIVGKVVLAIPYFGYVTAFARSLLGLIILIIIPATIIVYEEMKKIHHETKHIVRRRKEKKATTKQKKEKIEEIINTDPFSPATTVLKHENDLIVRKKRRL